MLTAASYRNCISYPPLALIEPERIAPERHLDLSVVDGLVSVTRQAWLAFPRFRCDATRSTD
ncbi:MAG TPA: hypothetical protein VFB54_04080 [Burkholderiales bacterium]|nr:hypothetical protein [Burkholderiales bacterium]